MYFWLRCLNNINIVSNKNLLNIISQLLKNFSQLQHVFRDRMEVFHGVGDVSGPSFYVQRFIQNYLVTKWSKYL